MFSNIKFLTVLKAIWRRLKEVSHSLQYLNYVLNLIILLELDSLILSLTSEVFNHVKLIIQSLKS